MKLQKHKTHKVGDKQYYKYVIVIPEETVKSLGWKEGEELEAEESNKILRIKMGK